MGEGRRLGGVESLRDSVVSGGEGSRRNENLGRKEAETRQMGLMGLMLRMRQCARKIAYWRDGEVKRLTVQWG